MHPRPHPAGPSRAPLLRLAVPVAALACLAIAGGAAAKPPADTLVVEARGNPDFLDPALAFSSESWQILANTGDGLMAYRPVSGPRGAEVVPDLAASAPVLSDGGRTYTFTLRPDARFGPPVERAVLPSDVKASLERLFAIDSRGAPLFRGIVGAGDLAAGKATGLRGITADDVSRRLVIRLERPDPAFLSALALPFAFVLPRGTPAVDQSARPPVATGPYYVARYEPDRRIELARNPEFVPRGAELGAGGPDRIVVQIGAKAEDAARRVGAGDTDYLQGAVPVGWTAPGGPAAGAAEHRTTAAATLYVALDDRVKPFSDARVRRALALALDPRRAAGLLGGAAVPTAQLLPPSSPGFARVPIERTNEAAARNLVRVAGQRGTRVTVWSEPENGQPALGRYVAGVLGRIGLRAKAQVLPSGGGLPAVTPVPNKVAIGVTRWDQVVPDGSDAYGWLLGRPGLGWPGAPFPTPSGDAGLRSAARGADVQTDPSARSKAWADVDRMAAARAPMVPMANPVRVEITAARVRGWIAHPVFGFLWSRASLGD